MRIGNGQHPTATRGSADAASRPGTGGSALPSSRRPVPGHSLVVTDAAAPWLARVGRAGAGGHPEIRTENLHKSFGAHHVLRGLNIQINAGEIVAVVGTSGSGKTVLLDCLTGLMQPTSGRVLVADHGAPTTATSFPHSHSQAGTDARAPLVDLATVDPDTLDRIRLHWAVVFQKNALFSGTVYDNIALWLREHTPMTEDQIRAIAERSLEAVALNVDDVMFKDREALSGGMAKRVAIARAIAVDPLVIFYDEPTTGLDPVVSGQIHELIWKTHHLPHASGSPRTTVIVTHDKELLRRLAPRIIMLDGGHVGFDGPYEQFSLARTGAAAEYLRVMPVLHARGDL